MRERLTARVLLIGPTGRLLLIGFEDPRPGGPHRFWATVGGGVEPGEDLFQAAAREVFEETGMTGLPLGPVVWVHDHVLELGRGPVRLRESYLMARTPSETLSAAQMTSAERAVVREMRWWTLGELAASTETIYPAGLPALLGSLLRGDDPAAPIDLGA